MKTWDSAHHGSAAVLLNSTTSIGRITRHGLSLLTVQELRKRSLHMRTTNSIVSSRGDGGSRMFGVAFPAAYMGNTIMDVEYGDSPVIIPGMEIVNTSWVVDCILNGGGFEGQFETGDWLKLILTSYVDDEPTMTEYYLADYRSENPTEHYYLNEWTWIDLSELGKCNVYPIHDKFKQEKLIRSDPTSPTYVCIDNVGITAKTNSIEAVVDSKM